MSDPSINFGHGKKVEYKNQNAISGESFKTPENANEKDVTIWQNKQALFKQFDTNNDNILDTREIKNMQSYINKVGGKHSKLTRDDLYNFTKQIAENTDKSIQTEWDDNILTVKENGKITISEYSDDAH